MNNFGDNSAEVLGQLASERRSEPGGFTEGSQGVALNGPAPPLDPAHKFHAPRRWCQNSLEYLVATRARSVI
jgi:hypothetical protein